MIGHLHMLRTAVMLNIPIAVYVTAGAQFLDATGINIFNMDLHLCLEVNAAGSLQTMRTINVLVLPSVSPRNTILVETLTIQLHLDPVPGDVRLLETLLPSPVPTAGRRGIIRTGLESVNIFDGTSRYQTTPLDPEAGPSSRPRRTPRATPATAAAATADDGDVPVEPTSQPAPSPSPIPRPAREVPTPSPSPTPSPETQSPIQPVSAPPVQRTVSFAEEEESDGGEENTLDEMIASSLSRQTGFGMGGLNLGSSSGSGSSSRPDYIGLAQMVDAMSEQQSRQSQTPSTGSKRTPRSQEGSIAKRLRSSKTAKEKAKEEEPVENVELYSSRRKGKQRQD